MSTDESCWDMFGDDDDDENDHQEADGDGQSQQAGSKACEEGVLFLTQHFLRANPQIPLSRRRVALSDGGLWRDSLEKRGIQAIQAKETTATEDGSCWDAAIVIARPCDGTKITTLDEARTLRRGIVAGGILLCVDSSMESCTTSLDPRVWNADGASVLYTCPEFVLVAVAKHVCLVNELACPWKPNRTNVALQQELQYLKQATVSRAAREILETSRLTESELQHAVAALQKHGYCIIKSLLDAQLSLQWGNAILQDFDAASSILLERDGVDLRHPQNSRNNPASYKEIAMREDLRVDLRDGPQLRKLRREESEFFTKWDIGKSDSNDENTAVSLANGPVITTTGGGVESCLRFYPDLLEIVKRTMNPKQNNLYRGNWGRYNFEGTGPDGSYSPLRIGPMGGILSLPGSADQAIHADTPHLFEHKDCLPAHYINAFALGADISDSMDGDNDGSFTGSTPVGGTAFIHGSHRLSVAADFNSSENSNDSTGTSREKMLSRLVRPSLQLGDVILFDCRVLHFGLANTSDKIERPMLYVNITHAWFHDPKNWDDRQGIFDL